MTEKTRYLGRESGKSSTRYFGPSERQDTEAGQHGYGARAGDGKTTTDRKVTVDFQEGDKK
jgi:hypothetical protein